ncbi:hypothetical protein COO60DRAFT_121768 [Scenedesmus sp. NREL 46B-D3]|nr:hypothetical protein COO60DRAFT_121768 [Scenedesmus sp. NREL 46B-D3]
MQQGQPCQPLCRSSNRKHRRVCGARARYVTPGVQQRQQQRRATGGSRTGPRALPNLCSVCGCGSSRDCHGVRAQVHVQQCSISVQALYFCPPGRPTRSCTAGWTLADALGQLEERGQSIPTAACLPYRPDYRRELTVGELCSGGCSSPSQHASKGRFTSTQINSMWEAQRHIRQYGAVVARFEVMSDFMAFFAEKRNAQAVYRPSAGAQPVLPHAIALIGYNNQQQYWLAKNSHGDTFGDGGLFKVAYGVSSVLTPLSGEAYGVMWTPYSTPAALQLPVTPAPRPGCYLYKARPGDYLSKVAWLAGIPLDRFMLDNTDQVKDLDAPLQGVQLLLCKPKQGAIKVPGSTPAPALGPGSAPASGDPQLEALLRVKAAVDSAGVLRDWTRAGGASGRYCRWKGVVCTKGTTSVYLINIWTGSGIQGLKGTLPPAAAFAGLGGLTKIGISDQPGITGTLPADWSRMAQLQDIRLADNSLTGSIPSSRSSLSKLKVLSLYENKLSGRVPDSLGALTSLEDVSWQASRFHASTCGCTVCMC